MSEPLCVETAKAEFVQILLKLACELTDPSNKDLWDADALREQAWQLHNELMGVVYAGDGTEE